MQRIAVTLSLCAVLLSAGCVSKKTFEESQAAVAACEEAKAQADAAVIAWEQRFDRESSRWTQMEANVSEAVPRALAEMHEERERIIEMVPEQVKADVESYLDEYFATVMKGFDVLRKDNGEIKLQLQATQLALQALGSDTRNIGAAIDVALTEEQGKRQAMTDQLAELSKHLSDVIDLIVEFDQTKVNCKSCPDRLTVSRKEREMILGFHAELMADLSDLQGKAAP